LTAVSSLSLSSLSITKNCIFGLFAVAVAAAAAAVVQKERGEKDRN
jgi:hypothetical protein